MIPDYTVIFIRT